MSSYYATLARADARGRVGHGHRHEPCCVPSIAARTFALTEQCAERMGKRSEARARHDFLEMSGVEILYSGIDPTCIR